MSAPSTGLVHAYYGNGKGKTTAAFGLAFRCAGHGLPVVIAQFFKSRPTGEVTAALRFPEITVLRGHPLAKFTFKMNDQEKAQLRLDCADLFDKACDLAISSNAALLVLDECIDACAENFLPIDSLLSFINSKPPSLEVALTGHSLPTPIADIADYISNVVCVKHPYEKGVTARKAIEF